MMVTAESQQIAAWKLLYRVQHPARYISRLQTIPSSDIELEFTHDRPSGSQVGRGTQTYLFALEHCSKLRFVKITLVCVNHCYYI
jgi:hypothetical protein